MKTVGLIGCGAIGTVLAEAIERKLVICDELIVFDVDLSKAEQLKKALKFPVTIVQSFEELLRRKPTVIVEAASQQAATEYDAARSLAEEQKDPLRAGVYNFNLGLALQQLGQNERAVKAFQRSKEQNRAASRPSLEARATLYQGIALTSINRTSKEPIALFEAAAKAFEQLKEDRYAGASYWYMAQQTAFTGDMAGAAKITEKAIPFLVSAGDKTTLATCYELVAQVYSLSTSEEEKAKAEKYKKLAEQIRKEIGK